MRCTRSDVDCEGYERPTPHARSSCDTIDSQTQTLVDQATNSSKTDTCSTVSRETSTDIVSSVDRPLSQWRLTDQQARGFAFFHLRTLPTLTIYNGSSEILFGRCIPCLATTNPAIRSQVTALGLFHLGGQAVCQGSLETPDALREYGQSLKYAIASDPSDNVGALLRCLMFVSIEFNRGRFFQAMMHLRRGLAILALTSCDGTKYRPGDPLCNVELFHLRKILTDIADAAGLITRFHDAEKGRRGPPDLNKPLDSYEDARRKGRQLSRWTLTCNEDEEYVTKLWNRFHRLAEDLVGKTLASPTRRSESYDVPILL